MRSPGPVPVDFELVPWLASVRGMVRFYLKDTAPFRLYVSPVNIDPEDPAQPIASPAEYARELFEAVGPFYTQEMPEDTKALSNGVLDPSEFLEQSGLVFEERRRLLGHELALAVTIDLRKVRPPVPQHLDTSGVRIVRRR